MNSLKGNLTCILLLFLIYACTNDENMSTQTLIEGALSDAKAKGIKIEYIVKSDIASADEYQLSDGTVIPCLTVEEIFIQNYSYAIKVVEASDGHVDLSFLSDKNALPEPIIGNTMIGEDVISYKIY